MSDNPVELFLTCGSWQEAQRIVDHLLDKQLINGAEFLPIKARSGWYGGWDEGQQIQLIMQSGEHLFDSVEAEIAKLHIHSALALESAPGVHM